MDGWIDADPSHSLAADPIPERLAIQDWAKIRTRDMMEDGANIIGNKEQSIVLFLSYRIAP